eukprot:TRINITY_DN2989_c0_g4_i1.p1 TRINITY_DN2989_c0_g4~~TRINITY_DN2989_c0_g4_i1.p1  ORF type:complete len:275 (-),score=48.04 TRINITY_DN2989_c0_g4_i1:152-976(-)
MTLLAQRLGRSIPAMLHRSFASIPSSANDIVEIIGGDDSSGLLFHCEHSSSRLPEPYKWSPSDAHFQNEHWGIDLGVESLTRKLCAKSKAPGILARFSRLLCDVNRPMTSETMFRKIADGKLVQLNENVDVEERYARMNRFYFPYHQTMDQTLMRCPNIRFLVSVHSFTNLYEGKPRSVEIGVLFDRHEVAANQINKHFKDRGYDSRVNEPWSGKDGFTFASDIHAQKQGLSEAVMVEARQDLLTNEKWQDQFCLDLLAAVTQQVDRIRDTKQA